MRRTSWIAVAAALVWAVLLTLVVLQRDQLAWALEAFPAELRGEGYPTHTHWQMYGDAALIWSQDGDAPRALDLVERSLAIETNADPLLLSAEIHAAEGDLVRARDLYQRLIEFDPSQVEGYLGLAEVHRRLGDPQLRLDVLRRGLAHFEERVEHFRPRRDSTVWDGFNDKADDVYEHYRRGAQILAANVRLLEDEQEPY